MTSPDSVRRLDVRLLKQEVAQLEKPPLRPRATWREVCRTKACTAFSLAVDALVKHGWSKRRIAKAIGCDVHTLVDWLEGKRQVPAWAVHALPREGRVGYVRAIIDSIPLEDEDDLSGKPLREAG